MSMVVAALASIVSALRSLLFLSPALLALCLLERFGPVYGDRPSLTVQLKGAVFRLVAMTLGVALATWIWLLTPRFPPMWPALALPLAFLISDFLQYWEHRVEHWLFWRVHSVHHAGRQLCAAMDVHHFARFPMMTVLYSLPMALLTRDPLGVTAVAVFTQVWGAYIHSPARLISIGPLRAIFADNRTHRIHHSLEPQHFEKNFGAILNIWDRMFGTYYAAGPQEWPATGIEEYGEIDTLRVLLLRPFMRRSATGSVGLAVDLHGP